jgi:hypothetical protein
MHMNEDEIFDQRLRAAESDDQDEQAEPVALKPNGHLAPMTDVAPVDPLAGLVAREAERQKGREEDRGVIVRELLAVDERRKQIMSLLKIYSDDDEGDHGEPDEPEVIDEAPPKRRARKAAKPPTPQPSPDPPAAKTRGKGPAKLNATLTEVLDWLSALKRGGSAKGLAEHLGIEGDKASVKASGLLGELRRRGYADHDGQRPATWTATKKA